MPAAARTAGLHPTKASQAAEMAAMKGTAAGAGQSTGITEITGIGKGVTETGIGKTGQTGASIAGGTIVTGGMTEAGSLHQEGRGTGMRKRQMVRGAARGRACI